MSFQFAAVTAHADRIIHFTLVGNPSVDVFESEFVRALDGLLSTQTKFSIVVDAQSVTGVSMTVAWTMIKWMRANKKQLQTYLRATGVVIVNPSVKSILDFVLSVQTPAAPMQITSTVADAWNFVVSHTDTTQ